MRLMSIIFWKPQLISIKTFKFIALVNDLEYRYFIRCESLWILQPGSRVHIWYFETRWISLIVKFFFRQGSLSKPELPRYARCQLHMPQIVCAFLHVLIPLEDIAPSSLSLNLLSIKYGLIRYTAKSGISLYQVAGFINRI